MQPFNNISNGESGSSVRGKLNNIFSTMITGREGINAIWAKLNALSNLSNTLGFIRFVKSTDYDPSGLDTHSDCALMTLIEGTFTNLKDENNTPITISASNSITIFYREADAECWDYDSQSLTPALNGEFTALATSIDDAGMGLLSKSGDPIAPLTLFSAVRNDENVEESLADVIENLKDSLRIKGIVQIKGALPENKSTGDSYFVSAEGVWYFWDGTSWSQLSGENPMTLTPSVTVGGITKDVQITGKTPSQILRDMLCPYVAPAISSKSVSPSLLLYGKQYTLNISVAAKKGSNALSKFTIDGTEINVAESTETVTKSLQRTVIPNNSAVSVLAYNVSVKDSENNTVSSSVAVNLTAGIFMFFSASDSISNSIALDFTAHNCQGEKSNPKGTYTLTHSGLEYLYIVAPNTNAMRITALKSSGFGIPFSEKFTSNTITQGGVTVNMRVYRTEEKQVAGTLVLEVNPN